jgi:hypothetical protein
MVVVVMMMMVRLRKCGSRNHQDHGKKQSLFHVPHHNNKGAACMLLQVTFGLHPSHYGGTPRLQRFTSGVYKATAPDAAFPQEKPHFAEPDCTE